MARTFRRIQTKLVHAGEPEPRLAGAVVTPIFQTAMYETAGESSYHAIRYIRLNNSPNHLVLHQKLAALENAEAALVAGSGMAAISTALLAVLEAGDHFLAQDCLYGGTHDLLTHDLPKMGLSCDFVNGDDPDSWKRKLRPNTKAIYFESLSNPRLQVPDLEAGVSFAREHGLISLIDNTFTSPINFRPAEHGFDVSLHSATKYLNGHSDIVAGACIGRAALIEKITHKLNHMGGVLDPHAAFLLHRGMKTLALRVAHQNRSALEIARFLEAHPAVTSVNYPGLESHPRHQRARKLFDGFGGMMSFEVKGGIEAAETFMRKTRIPIVAPSLGGPETLMTRPAATSHSGMSKGDRERVGVTDSLIRMSVGIEATEELIEDFDQALGAV
ncbi:MAG TPA: aminotransferase class I/II-fold pyridoxal phosphate-dependent enzyme [Vicinamibacterales bacterium]|jgi:cystathionine beta-lyase/cystathionine gamma-synthase|nr:aminotransferase class I/II-fold pyridoxal phosphate-dependent enzyme [Vicinamibacterales bacterium]